ncbi:hypothetical protein [Salinilacihabitans rarus]|uniref:hypothetical protein n=1 Tax=Salinilacihabitans rarus TaxID=2961596 RepID=UPI0020C86620|nr:hypothetical protein [Salinilacihabitans rarus]
MRGGGIYRVLRPDRYVLIVSGFFVLFPAFVDVVTPDVGYGHAGGTVDAQGNVVARYEGTTALQYRWYYPILYPFVLVWYVAVLLFDVADRLVPAAGIWYFSLRAAYFHLLAAVLVALLRHALAAVGSLRSRRLRGRWADHSPVGTSK